MKNKIAMINLGCAKNLVDAEKIMTLLSKDHYEFVQTYDDADLVIINTCGFINDAIEESLVTIADAMEHHGKVIVAGCLGKREDFIREKFPSLLHIGGPNSPEKVAEAVHHYLPKIITSSISCFPEHGIKLTPDHYAYIKISEGCNHQCTFCIIPQLRNNKMTSRSLEEIDNEARSLVDAGVKELLIVSQDTGAYGLDLGYKNGLFELSKRLGQLDAWIRLHYLYPYNNLEKIIPLMTDNKIIPYLDIPLQHADPKILQLMRRPGNIDNMLERIEKWRTLCPELTIRSTFIVGFPGETDKEFETLLTFLEEAQFDRVGCFKYSPVEGAKANEFKNHVPEDIKEERLNIFMDVQSQISADKLSQKIGTTLQVLVDDVDDEWIYARSYADSPEIDGQVIIQNRGGIHPGEFLEIKITDSDEHDLYSS